MSACLDYAEYAVLKQVRRNGRDIHDVAAQA